MKHAKNRSLTTSAFAAVALAAVACGGPKNVGEVGNDSQPTLLSVETGRLVDVYAYRRIDQSIGDRRLRANRQLELVTRNIVINSNIEGQSLFDAAGQPVANANFEYLPFDKTVGHEELVILWDDRPGPEQQSFNLALTVAQSGLGQVPGSYRGQNTQTRPIPIVARNAAIKLTFSGKVDQEAAFFAANPSALQLLEFKGDPAVVDPVDAFRILPYRIIPIGNTIILDTTILGGEAVAAGTTPGLPMSADNQTANIRIAIPTRGGVTPTFYIKEDPIPQLNDVDSAGRPSAIRDFRSGNLADGTAGRMREPEAPMIVAPLPVRIAAVDAANNIITLDKVIGEDANPTTAAFVPVRGRYPFVDGPLSAGGIPLGPTAAPVQRPLKFGDVLVQQIVDPDTAEIVTLRAEVLQNLEIVSTAGDPRVGLTATPPTSGSDQGEEVTPIHVRVVSVFAGKNSKGTRRAFQPLAAPTNGPFEQSNAAVRVRYYEENPFTTNSGDLSDRDWRELFVRIDPNTGSGATNVQPNSSVAVEFSKPMDLDQVDPTANLLITSLPATGTETFAEQMTDPKKATSRIVVTRLSDLAGDGTVLRLQPPMGFFHSTAAEGYRLNVRLGSLGVTDLAGNPLEVFQNAASPLDAWTVDFSMAPTALPNVVGWHVAIFEAEDEDGSPPGSVDFFGQYRLENGRLTAAATVRFGRSADRQSLQSISRVTRGECWDGRDVLANPAPPPPTVPNPAPNVQYFPLAPVDQNNVPHPGLLYWDPQMSAFIAPPVPIVYEYWQVQGQPVGRVIEPLKPQGSRMQMRYIEDDFSLSYRQPSDFGLDVEQLYWSPFNDENVQYDVFDRFTMTMAHGKRRPDEYWFLDLTTDPPTCTLACESMNSSLSTVFAQNVLDGTSPVTVFQDKVYAINPNQAFRTPQNTKFVPFPRFDRSYTWRDSRLVSVDASGNVIGLGGAQDPLAPVPNNDLTAKIDSPWVESRPVAPIWPFVPANPPQAFYEDPDDEFTLFGGSVWVEDPADFRGEAPHDHDPIALPLLVDFKVFADDQANGLAIGTNGFQMAMLGPLSYGQPPFGGYYDNLGSGCQGIGFPRWPRTRVHASGGFDLITGVPILVDPANVLSTTGSVVKDAGLGSPNTALFQAPAGDGMLNWARADFVRKVSTVTFGFFDTLRPQLSADPANPTTQIPGIPNLLALNPALRISDLVVQMDPPQARQPAGTSVFTEIRGAESFANSDVLYNPVTNDTVPDPTFAGVPGGPSGPAAGRGNLLNPNYACEAYRYSQPNFTFPSFDTPRVPATGLTKYVTEDQLAQIRNPATHLLPRFINPRLVMTNNVDVSPALSPSLRSLGFVYRMQPGQ